MFWNRYFRPSIILMLLITALHWVASFEGLYWSLDWYDIIMHFLGGLWTLLFGLWVVSTQYALWARKFVTYRNLILYVLAVGISWELLELALRFTTLDSYGYWSDTLLDLAMDLCGALSGIWIYNGSIKEIK